MRVREAAEVAELLVSTGYRDAVNAGFEQSPDKYMIQQTAAQAVIFEAFNQKGAMAERIWETRRMAALTEATGTDLGLFGDYIHSQGGKSKPAALTIADLPAGEPEVVKTNAAINGLNRVYSEPIDFLESALEFTTQRRQAGKGKVGPENYATMLKFFADKVQTFPSTHLDPVLTSTLANRAMDGFVDIAKVDKPNFVEMTNVYVAVRTLPPGAFAPRQSGPVIAHSLEQLPTFNNDTLRIGRAALSKLDLSDAGEAPATLVDLSFRKSDPLATTTEMRQGLRTVANLPPSLATDRAIMTFFDIRNQLEDPLDIEGTEEVTERLLYVVNEVTTDPKLTMEAREMARTSTARAVQIYTQARNTGDLTATQLDGLLTTVRRVGANFSQI